MTHGGDGEPIEDIEGTEGTGDEVRAVRYRIVDRLPDLIHPEEYAEHPQGRLVCLRLTYSADGVEILGDAFRPDVLERILESLSPEEIEQMMCG